jgi:hypothetical protein
MNEDGIKQAIISALPELSIIELDEIFTSLRALGVIQPSDLKYLKEEDFTTLSKIQARRACAYWNLGKPIKLL